MLSLGYSLLSKDLTIICAGVGLDPYLGFYHQPRFGGDDGADGADIFENNGNGVVSLVFNGGADEDIFVNLGTVADLNFGGDDGADLFQNSGAVVELVFSGGADDDVFQNNGTVESINFGGDEGADVLTNYGSFDSLVFTGGADDDVFASYGLLVGDISFQGDMDPAKPGFNASVGGNDTMIVRGSGDGMASTKIYFNGGKGNDSFQNNARGFSSITFTGGADDDIFQNNADGISEINFGGDDGADIFENNGANVDGLTFSGGADDDIFINDGASVADLVFKGGADDDIFVNTGENVSGINFGGDDGSDELLNTGTGLVGVVFTGGADDDIFINNAAGLEDLIFNGGADNDRFWNKARGVQSSGIVFNGDDGADIFINDAASVADLTFKGGADNDGFQNNGSNVLLVTVDGGSGMDTVINTGAQLAVLVFGGGSGNDTMRNRGFDVGRIEFNVGQIEVAGDDGADVFINEGIGAAKLVFVGGADDDVFTNNGEAATLIFTGGADDDIFQNNGTVEAISFYGDDGDDLFQNNGSAVSLVFHGGADDDTFVNNADNLLELSFGGDDGVDTLINNGDGLGSLVFMGGADSDYLRLLGSNLGDVDFQGGDGSDTFEYNGVAADGKVVSFSGESGDDFLAWQGAASSAIFQGGSGNDLAFIVGTGVLALNGDEGNDTYTFIGNPRASVTIGETYTGASDATVDTVVFSSFTGGAITVDLRSTLPQPQGIQVAPANVPNFTLTLVDGMGVEAVVGTPFGDTIQGNARDNILRGAEYFDEFGQQTGSTVIAGQRGETQWVLLDFDSRTETGEHVYTPEEREAIQRRVESVYRGPNTGALWFDVRVVLEDVDIPYQTDATTQRVDYATLYFNDTPASGRPGGLASEVDLGNVNLGGSAQVQINGLLGGAVTAEEANTEKEEAQPSGLDSGAHSHATLFGDAEVGSLKPEATSENYIKLSSKVAAHELGHLLGLRHQDSFGPIGYGIHNPPGGGAYNPTYTGPAGGFESFDHLAGSPASIGSSRFTDLNDLFFGEREAVKLAFAGSDSAITTLDETHSAGGSHNSFASAQTLQLVNMAVPNTLSKGLNAAKSQFVQLKSVIGQIKIDASTVPGVSESDWYAFSGKAGELVNIDVLSNSLVGRFGSAPNDYIDSIVRVYSLDGSGQPVLVPYHSGVAVNDDQFEPTDSSLIDLVLPANGTYYIEVDTFARAAGDPLSDPTNPSSPLHPSNTLRTTNPEVYQRFVDTVLDTDTGKYQLILYRYASANSTDDIDFIKGNGGVDQVEAGSDDDYSTSFALGGTTVLHEGDTFSRKISLSDRAATSWEDSSIDYGDGSAPQTLVVKALGDGSLYFDLEHIYQDNDADSHYKVTVTIVNDIGNTISESLLLTVANLEPTNVNAGADQTVDEGDTVSLSGSFTDPGGLDTHTQTWSVVASNGQIVSDGSGGSFSFVPNDNGTYTVTYIVLDDDGGSTSDAMVVTVKNVIPLISGVIVDAAVIDENGWVKLSGSFTDAGTQDTHYVVINWGDNTM